MEGEGRVVLVADDPLERRISFWTDDDVALPQVLCRVFREIGRDLEDENDKRQYPKTLE